MRYNVLLKTIVQTEIFWIVLDEPVQNCSSLSECSPSTLMYFCKGLNQLECAFWYSLRIVFNCELTPLLMSRTQENFLSASLSFKRGKNQKSHSIRLGLYSGLGKTWILRDMALVCRDWHFHGGGGFSG